MTWEVVVRLAFSTLANSQVNCSLSLSPPPPSPVSDKTGYLFSLAILDFKSESICITSPLISHLLFISFLPRDRWPSIELKVSSGYGSTCSLLWYTLHRFLSKFHSQATITLICSLFTLAHPNSKEKPFARSLSSERINLQHALVYLTWIVLPCHRRCHR